MMSFCAVDVALCLFSRGGLVLKLAEQFLLCFIPNKPQTETTAPAVQNSSPANTQQTPDVSNSDGEAFHELAWFMIELCVCNKKVAKQK